MSRRTLAEFGKLLAGEQTLLEGLSSGDAVLIGGGAVPDANAEKKRQLRGEFLRYLILGGCEMLSAQGVHQHEKGVQIVGALITGLLDLEGCRIPCDLALFDCRFEQAPVFRSARIDNLFLDGSHMPGLVADRLQAEGGIYLRDAHVLGEVTLPWARLGGNLECRGAHLEAVDGGDALFADGMETKGGVILRNAQTRGEVRMLGARLGRNLECDGARMTAKESGVALYADGLETSGDVYLDNIQIHGEVRMLGIRLGGDFACVNACLDATGHKFALSLDGARIGGCFFLRSGTRIKGVLSMVAAEIGQINDDMACWPKRGNLHLNRCRYGAFTGISPVSADVRINWLLLQTPQEQGYDFWPQPWEQCASVMREMGHREEARRVLIAKEKHQRAALRARLRHEHLYEDAMWRGFWDRVLAVTVRYGHTPLLAFAWLFGFWLLGIGVFTGAQTFEAIKPNAAFVLRSSSWAHCAPDYHYSGTDGKLAPRNQGTSQLACFNAQLLAKSYPKFNAAIYSADTLLPMVGLEMQGNWIPDEGAVSAWGKWARWYLWLQIIVGWGLSLLAVAGFSGLIKKD